MFRFYTPPNGSVGSAPDAPRDASVSTGLFLQGLEFSTAVDASVGDWLVS